MGEYISRGLQKAVDTMRMPVHGITQCFAYIALGGILWMMCITVAEVTSRRVFNAPIPNSSEYVWLFMGVVAFSCFAWTQWQKSHITIGFLADRLPPRPLAMLQAVVHFTGMLMYCFLTWRLAAYSLVARQSVTLTEGLEWPYWPFYVAAAIGVFVFVLVLMRDTFQYLAEALGKRK